MSKKNTAIELYKENSCRPHYSLHWTNQTRTWMLVAFYYTRKEEFGLIKAIAGNFIKT